MKHEKNFTRLTVLALVAALALGTVAYGAATDGFGKPGPGDLGYGKPPATKGGPGGLESGKGNPGHRPMASQAAGALNRAAAIVAFESERVIASLAGVFAPGSLNAVMADALAADAHELSRLITHRFDGRVHQYRDRDLGKVDRARALEELTRIVWEESFTSLTDWSRVHTSAVIQLDAVRARIFAEKLARYLPALASRIAAKIRAELEDEFGVIPPPPPGEDGFGN